MTENTTEENVQPQEGVKLTSKQLWKKILLETADLLKGAAFPFIVACVISSLIIMFTTYTDELGIQIVAAVAGEGLYLASMVMFGRTNGSAAYKVKLTNATKRTLNTKEEKVLYKTGEYAAWKGFLIGFITAIPFLIFQIIACTGEYRFVTFMLEYACGWAVAPFEMAGLGLMHPYILLMALVPVAFLGGFYIYGKYWEDKRQQKITRAEDDKRKGSKKHYYEENKYDDGKRYKVDMDKNGKKK